ncbi:MAG TPA: saccharopine dehydrogenase C-terminal domain-containing protein [Azospirillaceae bacterium]|nr:saccharopine dehydrogenase C-terminal domain-containing protein [Azospirillaceae bacterium]
MRKIVIAGAGKIGATLADMLGASGSYAVTVIDGSAAALDALEAGTACGRRHVDVRDATAMADVLSGAFAVLSAVPYDMTVPVAEAATASGVHYLDLTEDVAATRRVKALAPQARSALIPQCGLAPGFISIVANGLASSFERLDSVRLRVGALPRYPSNALNYNLTWSVDGVINEYCEPCEAVVEGQLRETPPLEGLEEFALDGVTYEAFNTSGGLGTLAETWAGKVRTLNYKTIRYPGHCAVMKALLEDLRFRHKRGLLKSVLQDAVPSTLQDVVVIFATVCGERGGRLEQETFAARIHGGAVGGHARSAIQVTTAAGIAAVLDLLAEGAIRGQGLVRQEEIALDRFLANRFGRVYAAGASGQAPGLLPTAA